MDDFDSCNQLGNLSHPFCIFKHNGSIVMNRNFTCVDGEQFEIRVNVTDSADNSKGKIWNSNGSVVINCTDPCRLARQAYDKASKLCSLSPPEQYAFTNNGSRTMQVRISAYRLYKIHLMKEKAEKKLESCTLMIAYTHRLKGTILTPLTGLFNFSINDTIKELRLATPLQLEVSSFTVSLACSGDNGSLSNITNLRFTAQLYESCTSINKTCLKALYEDNTISSSNCPQDSLNLMGYYGRCIGEYSCENI